MIKPRGAGGGQGCPIVNGKGPAGFGGIAVTSTRADRALVLERRHRCCQFLMDPVVGGDLHQSSSPLQLFPTRFLASSQLRICHS